jgi:hypothetical protein
MPWRDFTCGVCCRFKHDNGVFGICAGGTTDIVSGQYFPVKKTSPACEKFPVWNIVNPDLYKKQKELNNGQAKMETGRQILQR